MDFVLGGIWLFDMVFMVFGIVVSGGRGSLEGLGNLLRLEEVEIFGLSKGCGKVFKFVLLFLMEL